MVDEVQNNRPHTLDGAKVETKRATPREDSAPGTSGGPGGKSVKKVFVGGLKDDIDDKAMEEYFGTFGTVTKIEQLVDKVTGRKRGFGFVEFDDYDPVDKLAQQSRHQINGRRIDIKRAVGREEMNDGGGGRGGYGGGREGRSGGRDVRGGGGAPSPWGGNSFGGGGGGGYGGNSSFGNSGFGNSGGGGGGGWGNNQGGGGGGGSFNSPWQSSNSGQSSWGGNQQQSNNGWSNGGSSGYMTADSGWGGGYASGNAGGGGGGYSTGNPGGAMRSNMGGANRSAPYSVGGRGDAPGGRFNGRGGGGGVPTGW